MGSHGDRPHPTNWLERPDLIIHNVRIPYKDTDGLWVIKCRGGRVWSVKPNHNFREGPISIASTRVVDGKGGLLLPSLCHAHIHLDKCFILDECEPLVSGTFSEAMEVTKKAKAKFHQRREDLYARGHRIITESLEYGVTSIRAHVEIDKVVRFACLDVALKLADEWKGSCDVQICAFAQEALFDRPKDDIPTDNFALLKMACARDGVMVVGSAPYVEPTIKQAKQNIDLILDLSMERGIHADFHLDYNLDPKSEPLIYHVVDRVRARKWGGLLKIPCLTSTEMHVTIGHATRLTLFSPDEWRDLQARIGSLPISIVGLPQSDMYMMGRSSAPLGAPRGTLRIPQLAAEHGINAAMSVNNIENAFTPQGSLDPLTLCSLGVGVFQSGRPADLDVLLRSVTLTAKRAIGLHNIPDQLHPAKRERADFVIIHNATSLQSAVLNPSFDRTTIFAEQTFTGGFPLETKGGTGSTCLCDIHCSCAYKGDVRNANDDCVFLSPTMTQPEPSSPPHQVSSTATDAKDSRVHDRLVRHFESHPLRDFQNAAELMTVTHEAYKAHRSVYEGHGYIHGDVSDQTVTLTIQDGVRGDALIDLDCGKNFTYVDVLKSTDVFKDILSDGITMDSGKANATNSETDAELASMLRFFGM